MSTPVRLLAALVMIALGGAVGHSMGESIRRRAQCLLVLMQDTQRLENAMLQERLMLMQALEKCQSPILRGPLEGWRERLSESGLPLSARDTGCVQELMEQLGQGGAAGQRLLLPRIRAQLGELREEALEKYRTLGRLYTSLGTLFALALALTFI